jgi:hypothetical protein
MTWPDIFAVYLCAEIMPEALQLMTDVFGNYVVQKLFEYGNREQIATLAAKLDGNVLSLSLQVSFFAFTSLFRFSRHTRHFEVWSRMMTLLLSGSRDMAFLAQFNQYLWPIGWLGGNVLSLFLFIPLFHPDVRLPRHSEGA